MSHKRTPANSAPLQPPQLVNSQEIDDLAVTAGALLLIFLSQAAFILAINFLAKATGDAALATFITLVAAGKGALPIMAIYLTAVIGRWLLWILRHAIKLQARRL